MKDERGQSAIEGLIVVAIAVAAITMVGLFLITQLAVTITPNLTSLDANSNRFASLSIQGLFSMINTIVPIVAAVIVVLLLAIALAVVLGAVKSNRNEGGSGGYQM